MKGYLLDTNYVSELVRIRPEPRVMSWIEATEDTLLYLSVLTLGEIRKGIALLPRSSKRQELERWLEIKLPTQFGNRILAINGPIADLWGLMTAQTKQKGITLPMVDGLIAATAIHHKLMLVTRNIKDFAVWNVPLLNPWED